MPNLCDDRSRSLWPVSWWGRFRVLAALLQSHPDPARPHVGPRILHLELPHTSSSLLQSNSCLGDCLFPVDGVSRSPSFSPCLVKMVSVFPALGGECLSPEQSGMKTLGGIVSTAHTTGSLFLPSWSLPPGHCQLFVLLFQSLQHEPLLSGELALLCGAHNCHLFKLVSKLV